MSAALRLLDTPRPPPVIDIREARKKGLTVRLESVEKSFGQRRVLEPLDLDFKPGEFVAVVGRSGGGKSTLLRLLAGLETPTAGRVLLDGTVYQGPPPSVRMLFQDARLLPWQRVIQNVGIGRVPGWRDRAQAALSDVGLADRGEDWPAVLSGGQRQRVALARALVSNPHLLLLDEPFGALDALTRREMHALLLRLWHRDHFTTLLITHDVSEAVTLADRVLVLNGGRVVLDAEVRASRPREPDDHHIATLEREILAAV